MLSIKVGREIPVAGIPTGIYQQVPSLEMLKILAKMGNTGKYDFLFLFHSNSL